MDTAKNELRDYIQYLLRTFPDMMSKLDEKTRVIVDTMYKVPMPTSDSTTRSVMINDIDTKKSQ